jgi:hypothetical protein
MKSTHVYAEAAGSLDGGGCRSELPMVGSALWREGEIACILRDP